MARPLPRLPDAILLLYPRTVRQRHGAELASLAEDLVRRDGRSRPAVMVRLAADGLAQRLASTATAWTVTVALAVTTFTGLALCDFAAASAHPGPHRAVPVHAHAAAHVQARLHRHHRTARGRAGIIGR